MVGSTSSASARCGGGEGSGATGSTHIEGLWPAPTSSAWSPMTPGPSSFPTQKIPCGVAGGILSLGQCHSFWESWGQAYAPPSPLVSLESLGDRADSSARRTQGPAGLWGSTPCTFSFGTFVLVHPSINNMEHPAGKRPLGGAGIVPLQWEVGPSHRATAHQRPQAKKCSATALAGSQEATAGQTHQSCSSHAPGRCPGWWA